MVDTAKYIGGRLTAPAGGEGSGDSKVREGQRDMQSAANKAKAHGHGLMDRAREAYGDAKHQVSEGVEDAKHRVTETAEQARQRARDAAERARPHTVEVPHIHGQLVHLCVAGSPVDCLETCVCGCNLSDVDTAGVAAMRRCVQGQVADALTAWVQEAEKAEGYPPSNTASLRARKMEGLDKERLARAQAPTASQMEDKTIGAMESAGDLATRSKCAAVGWCAVKLDPICDSSLSRGALPKEECHRSFYVMASQPALLTTKTALPFNQLLCYSCAMHRRMSMCTRL